MRLISIVTAVVVVAVLYLLVFQRDDLLSFSGQTDAPATAETVADIPQEPVAGSIAVVAQQSAARMIDSAVILRGRTEAARQVDVRAETGGLVTSEPLRKGAKVAAGDLLCRIEPGTRGASLSEAQSRREEALARLADAEINERAAERLSEDGFAAETRVTAARAAVQAARAGVQSADAAIAGVEKDLERLEIRAPFEGLLETDTAEIGSLLQPGALCATVIQLDPMKMVGFAAETEVDRIEVGAQAAARLASGREVVGNVTFLSRSADPTTRTFRVEAEVDNADLSIRDGQTAEILIASDGAIAHLVPQSALTLNDEGRLGVRLVTAENVAAFAPVSVLRDTTEGIWVAGLDEQVSVIVVGQEFVTDGVPVTPSFRGADQ